ncbi:MAG: hypothetical protein PWP48_1931 [Clostridiales bacterium]|jgi:hypothetical protein|nr:hypothetical protein [Clostridiales bacterium]MDK2992698.1 hypothetical protein [Clostridiales bacterium]
MTLWAGIVGGAFAFIMSIFMSLIGADPSILGATIILSIIISGCSGWIVENMKQCSSKCHKNDSELSKNVVEKENMTKDKQ